MTIQLIMADALENLSLKALLDPEYTPMDSYIIPNLEKNNSASSFLFRTPQPTDNQSTLFFGKH